MNTLRIKGFFNEVMGTLKQKFANVKDDSTLFMKGKETELVGRLQKNMGKSKDTIRKFIEKI